MKWQPPYFAPLPLNVVRENVAGPVADFSLTNNCLLVSTVFLMLPEYEYGEDLIIYMLSLLTAAAVVSVLQVPGFRRLILT